MVLTLGGVHKIQILIRDSLKEIKEKYSAKKWEGSGGPRPPYVYTANLILVKEKQVFENFGAKQLWSTAFIMGPGSYTKV